VLKNSRCSICAAQPNPKVENTTTTVLHAFETHDIVMIREQYVNKQEYEWLRSLIATPEFADRVDDIVMEFGNSLYQKSVDRYVSGEAFTAALLRCSAITSATECQAMYSPTRKGMLIAKPTSSSVTYTPY
jgi:hypothetical protein